MAVESIVTPSKEARRLFNSMVARSDDNLCLSIEQSLMLGVQRRREGLDAQAINEVTELVNQRWIEPTSTGWAIRGLLP